MALGIDAVRGRFKEIVTGANNVLDNVLTFLEDDNEQKINAVPPIKDDNEKTPKELIIEDQLREFALGKVSLEELTEFFDNFKSVDAKERLHTLARFFKKLERLYIEAYELEKKAKAQRESAHRGLEGLKSIALTLLNELDVKKEVWPDVTTAIRKDGSGKLTVENEDDVPGKFKITKTVTELDSKKLKDAIKDAYPDGKKKGWPATLRADDIPGARVDFKDSVQIK